MHLEDLEKAGIGTDLLDAEVNIEGGSAYLNGVCEETVLRAN